MCNVESVTSSGGDEKKEKEQYHFKLPLLAGTSMSGFRELHTPLLIRCTVTNFSPIDTSVIGIVLNFIFSSQIHRVFFKETNS